MILLGMLDDSRGPSKPLALSDEIALAFEESDIDINEDSKVSKNSSTRGASSSSTAYAIRSSAVSAEELRRTSSANANWGEVQNCENKLRFEVQPTSGIGGDKGMCSKHA